MFIKNEISKLGCVYHWWIHWDITNIICRCGFFSFEYIIFSRAYAPFPPSSSLIHPPSKPFQPLLNAFLFCFCNNVDVHLRCKCKTFIISFKSVHHISTPQYTHSAIALQLNEIVAKTSTVFHLQSRAMKYRESSRSTGTDSVNKKKWGKKVRWQWHWQRRVSELVQTYAHAILLQTDVNIHAKFTF